MLKPSSSMGNGEKPGGETLQGAFSRGGRQKGERKRLKSGSSSNEIWRLREKLPRKAHPIPRSELPSPLVLHLLPSTRRADIGPKIWPQLPPWPATLKEKDGGGRTRPWG